MNGYQISRGRGMPSDHNPSNGDAGHRQTDWRPQLRGGGCCRPWSHLLKICFLFLIHKRIEIGGGGALADGHHPSIGVAGRDLIGRWPSTRGVGRQPWPHPLKIWYSITAIVKASSVSLPFFSICFIFFLSSIFWIYFIEKSFWQENILFNMEKITLKLKWQQCERLKNKDGKK